LNPTHHILDPDGDTLNPEPWTLSSQPFTPWSCCMCILNPLP
jgi:hypothetical protein